MWVDIPHYVQSTGIIPVTHTGCSKRLPRRLGLFLPPHLQINKFVSCPYMFQLCWERGGLLTAGLGTVSVWSGHSLH